MLISTTLIFLGMPLWLVAGMLILIFWNQRRVKKQPGSFPVRIKKAAEPEAKWKPKW